MFDAGSSSDLEPGVAGAGDVRSCEGLPHICGPCGDDDCCAAPLVPGGTFLRSYDGVTFLDGTNPATVSDFRLDRYEVTVGRMRRFVEAYRLPFDGDGKNPNDPLDEGWNRDVDRPWGLYMPHSAPELRATLGCGEAHSTWTDEPGENEALPIGCVSWFVAYAFCIWDGGRLPTEAEWNYAAAGGDEQRVYPWSVPPDSTTIDGRYAAYWPEDGAWDGPYPPPPVGATAPKGLSRWGHADLVGSVWEYVRDWYGPYPNPCVDCANHEPELQVIVIPTPGGGEQPVSAERVGRGGSSDSPAFPVSHRDSASPTLRDIATGFRCARSP